jgi:hypothetical protein
MKGIGGKKMKKGILILISFFILTACSTPITFQGNTAHWKIEINASNAGNNQDVTATFIYKGKLSKLKKYKHLEISFKTPATSGGEKLDSKNGLNKKQFTVTTSGNGAKITENTIPTATIVLGENGQKETTKLVRK